MKVQVFDLDGTLVQANSFHLWIRFLASRHYFQPTTLLQLGLCLGLRGLRQIDHAEMKYRVLRLSQGMGIKHIEAFAMQLESRLHTEVLRRFQQAQAEGQVTCLNTAAPELYATVFGQRLGFDAVIATPRPDGLRENWYENLGPQKVLGLQQRFPKAEIVAVYSDEAADLPLMRLAGKVCLINPRHSALAEVLANGIQPEVIS